MTAMLFFMAEAGVFSHIAEPPVLVFFIINFFRAIGIGVADRKGRQRPLLREIADRGDLLLAQRDI
jgi:hypothetical protein